MAQTHRNKRNKRTRRNKRTQRNKRMRGGVDDNESDAIRAYLRELFPEFDISRFTIKETDDDYTIILTKCEEKAKHGQGYRPQIIVYKDGRMRIDRLTSCTMTIPAAEIKIVSVSGPEIIKRYISLARKLGLSSITLHDESEVYFPRLKKEKKEEKEWLSINNVLGSHYGKEKCAVYLPILYILQHGKSWYESLGFMSATSEAERAQNEEIRQMPFGLFVQRLIETDRQATRERLMRYHELNNNTTQRNKEMEKAEKKKSELEGLHEAFPEIDDATSVHDAIKQMVNRVNKLGESVNNPENVCDSVQFRMLQKVIDTCVATKKPLVHYRQNKLTMTL